MLEFICKKEIRKGVLIEKPQGANFYNSKRNYVYFYKGGNMLMGGFLDDDIVGLKYQKYQKFKHWTFYGSPKLVKK